MNPSPFILNTTLPPFSPVQQRAFQPASLPIPKHKRFSEASTEPDRLAFSALGPPKQWAGSLKKLKNWPKKHLTWGNVLRSVQYANPLFYLAGGVTVLLSGALHLHPVKQVARQTFFPRQAMIIAQNPKAPDPVQELEKMLSLLGWRLISLGGLTGCYANIVSGVDSKQPSWVLGGALSAIPSAFLYFDPSIPARAALYTCLAIMYSGYANKLANKFKKEDEPLRTFDLKRLSAPFQKKLKRKEALQEFEETLKELFVYVKNDQVRLFKPLVDGFANAAKLPAKIKKQGIKATSDQVFGHLKKGLTDAPVQQAQLSSLLTLIGGIPMMFIGGEVGGLQEILSRTVGVGLGVGQLSVLTEALNTPKNRVSKWGVIVGIPVQFLCKMSNGLGNIAVPAERLTMGMINWFFIQEQAEDRKRLSQETPLNKAA